MNWYILYTAARAEKQVERRLNMDGIETYLPLHLSPRRWSDRVKLVEVPLFSSYIFVRTAPHKLWDLLRLPGIARIVFFENAPATISSFEIESISRFVEESRGKECLIVENDEVEIAFGPLKNRTGKVMIKKGGYLILRLDKLGFSVKVQQQQVIKKVLL